MRIISIVVALLFATGTSSVAIAGPIAAFKFEGTFTQHWNHSNTAGPSVATPISMPFTGRFVYDLSAELSSLIIPGADPSVLEWSRNYAFNVHDPVPRPFSLVISFGDRTFNYGPLARGSIGVVNQTVDGVPSDEFRLVFGERPVVSGTPFPEGYHVWTQFELLNGAAFDDASLPTLLDPAAFELPLLSIGWSGNFCAGFHCPSFSYRGEITMVRAVPEPSGWAIVATSCFVFVSLRRKLVRVCG